MKRIGIALAIAFLLPLMASAERGGRQAVPLDAPADVMCTIDGVDMFVDVSWDAVAGATKYAVSLECEDPTGSTEVEIDYEPEERLLETTASVPFDQFPVEVILDGDGAWTCLAKVKGLNPPGRKQSHPQGVALCE